MVEMSIIIVLIALVTLTSVREVSWKTRCNMALVPWNMSLRSSGNNLVSGPFGTCSSVTAWDVLGPYRSGHAVMKAYLCDAPVDSSFVRGWRIPCGL